MAKTRSPSGGRYGLSRSDPKACGGARVRTVARNLTHLQAVLDREFPDPKSELRFSNPLELLVATILSAQCTDERVNRVTADLFRRYRTAEDYARADPAVLEAEIRPTGFFRVKAKNIIRCGRVLIDRHGGEVPATMESLVGLPGVWRKTASVILGNGFHRPAIVVDTHVRRVSMRVGLSDSDDPDRIEADLAGLIPQERWTRLSHQLLLHGRYICLARTPRCGECELRSVCRFYKSQPGPGPSIKV